jgi:hypothetical protein
LFHLIVTQIRISSIQKLQSVYAPMQTGWLVQKYLLDAPTRISLAGQ